MTVHDPDEDQTTAFNDALAISLPAIVGCNDREDQGGKLIAALKEAAEGSAAYTKWEKCPKMVQKLKHYNTHDYKLRQWRRKLAAADRVLSNGQLQQKIISAVPWKLDEARFEGLEVDKLHDVQWRIENGRTQDIRTRMVNQIKRINDYLSRIGHRVQRGKISEALKKRNELFDEATGKGKGRLLARVMRKQRQVHEITSMRKPDKDADGAAELAYTEEDVGKVVGGHYGRHFEEKVNISGRWRSRRHMSRLDTEGMPTWQKRLIKRRYLPVMDEKEAKAISDGI